MELTTTTARSAVFAPLDDRGRAETVAERLEGAIVLGILHPGERLPAEARLAVRFGVATVTVREALAELRSRELVRTQRGRGGGSFVSTDESVRNEAMTRRIRVLSRVELVDLGTYCGTIVGGGARLAARDASDRDISSLARELASADFSSELAARRALGGFHLAVVALSRSVRLVREQIRFQHADGPLLWASMAVVEEREAALAAAERLVSAIGAGDPEAAATAVDTAASRAVRWLITTKSALEEQR